MSVSDTAATAPAPRARLLRNPSFLLALVQGLLWLFGAVRFLRADGSTRMTLPRREKPPAEEHNVASYRYGPTLRASSYHRDPTSQHHPIFLVDGRYSSMIEKWASDGRDREPWVEISWREPRTISRVLIRHAGVREDHDMTLHNYRLRCLLAAGEGPTLDVRGNMSSVAQHALRCVGARGLRVDWTPNDAGDIARVYELEVWGR